MNIYLIDSDEEATVYLPRIMRSLATKPKTSSRPGSIACENDLQAATTSQ